MGIWSSDGGESCYNLLSHTRTPDETLLVTALRFCGVKAFLIIRKRSLFKIAHIKDLSEGNSCRRIQGKGERQGFRKGWHQDSSKYNTSAVRVNGV